MSIYIGKTPISSAWSSVSATASNASTPMVLTSDHKENFIQFQNFRMGQWKENNTATFQLYQSNVLLTQYSSNLLFHTPNALFLQNVAIQSDLQSGSNVTTRTASACNVTIYMKDGIPLKIMNENTETVFQIGLNGQTFFTCNLGVGIINPTYRLEVADSMRVQSNIIIGNTLDTSKLNTNVIYGKDNISTRIEFNPDGIHLISTNTVINNPSLVGNITYGATISLDQTTINQLEASNLQVANNKANQQAIYIQQINPGGFANTATGNPLHIESYFALPNKSIPVFVVDTLGRISSGRTTASIPEPDAAYSYYIDKDRYPYLSGFLNFTSCNDLVQTIINKKGYISIGSNQTMHPLQITNPYSGYESKIPNIESLIGLYQTDSNQYAYLQCYDSNQNIVFQITNTGKVLFESQPQYDASYQLEIQKRAYIRTLDTSNIFSSGGIDFMNSSLSNIDHLETEKLYAQSGVMSNVFFHNPTVDNIQIDAFDYVSKAPNYTEFRIIPDRFLFYGSNLVMNPNPYFFEVEQTILPKDNVRIYANGGPNQSVNVIRTIGNNQQSQVRIYNCNDAVNSISRVVLQANQEGYTFGVINLSMTPGEQSEAFITDNSDLTNRSRQLSIHPEGIRIGESIHFLKDATTTIGYATPGKRTLTVVGEAEFKNNAGQNVLHIKDNGNIGIGTDTPRANLELQSQTVYISGNLGIGNLNPSYPVDVNGTVRATRILGGLFDDVVGGSFSNITPWSSSSTSNAYYIIGNVGIGTTHPIVPFHLHSSNIDTRKQIEVGPLYYTGSWPPIGSESIRYVTSNIISTETSNVLAPFMPIYPANYLNTANVRNVTTTIYGKGIYTAKSSSTESGIPAYYTFNNNPNDYWASDSSITYRYNAISGAYEGDTILGGVSGEWIQLFCPNTFILRKYIISGPSREEDPPDTSYDVVSPRNWTLLASNTSSAGWNTLHTVTDGYIGSGTYTKTYHLNQDISYDVYAIVVTKANESLATYGQIGISDLQFYEGSNQRLIPLTYPTYQLVGNTSNIATISISNTAYNSGTYKVSMTSNYTQQPYLDLQYSFNTSSVPYTVSSTPISYIQQSDLSGFLNASSSVIFTTLSNAFISTSDTNPPLSFEFTYPTLTNPILIYSIVGPSIINYAPRKWTISGSSDGIDWTQIDSQNNITWTSSETKTFTLASPSTYSQYRYDFYRNNSATYAPLSLKCILTYGNLRTQIPSLNYTTYPSTISGYNQPPRFNLSQFNISGGVIVGSNSMMSNITLPNNSVIIDGSLGIGTTLPLRSLHVQGDTRIVGNMSNEGRLYIGTNSGGNIGGGIYFGGTTSDANYDHTVIENRTYVASIDQQKSELLFFKGNDSDITSNGSDRIRLRAGEIRFDVYPIDTVDRYTECNVVMINSYGTMTVNDTLYTSNLMTSSLQSRNSTTAAFYQYTYFTPGTYTLPTIPEYGCSQARIQMWGAGGGGAGGNIQGTIAPSAGTILGGAGGGGGGAYGEVILPYELLFNSTLTTTIGTGGAGGNGGSINTTITTTTNSGNATNGTAGTATTLTLTTNSSSAFSYTWTVNGGGGGKVSTTTTAGNLGAGGYPVPTTSFTVSQKGGDGGIGGTTNTGGANGGSLIGNGYAASGGGGGAGQPATNTSTALYYSGGNSGNASKIESYLIGSTAFAFGNKVTSTGTTIVSAQPGYTILQTYTGGTGGGGGSGNTGNIASGYINGYGEYGLIGGYPGGGGGGGGAAREITTLGSSVSGYTHGGGAGADGGLILTYY